MKRTSSFAFFLTVALLLFSSCSEKETTHTYVTQSVSDFSGEERVKVNEYLVKTYPYFGESHTYFGLWRDTFEKACEEFASECKKIDNEAMVEQLPANSTFLVQLFDATTSQVAAQSQVWTRGAIKPDPITPQE